MTFKVGDRVRLVKLTNSDSQYIISKLHKTGTVFIINEDFIGLDWDDSDLNSWGWYSWRFELVCDNSLVDEYSRILLT